MRLTRVEAWPVELRLAEPYEITDAGPSPDVHVEWADEKQRRFILGDGARHYLDGPQDRPPLSPQAVHMQDVLSGLAKAPDEAGLPS